MECFFLSGNSVGYLAAAILTVIITVYLFTQKNKYIYQWLLAFFFLFQSLSHIGNTLWFSFYTQGSAYAPYLVYLIWIGLVVLMQFAYYYSNNIYPGESKIALAVSILAGFVSYAHYISQTQPMIADFSIRLHNFSPQPIEAEHPLSIVILCCSVWTVIVFIRKTVRLSTDFSINLSRNFRYICSLFIHPQGSDSQNTRNILLPVLFVVLIATSFYLNISGNIRYETYAYINIIASIILCFLFLVTFNTKSSESCFFTLRLISIFLVIMFISITVITKLSIRHLEKSYNNDRIAEVRQVRSRLEINDLSSLPERVKYIVSMPITKEIDETDIQLTFIRGDNFKLITLVNGIKSAGLETIENRLSEYAIEKTTFASAHLAVSNNINSIYYPFFMNYKLYMVGYDYFDLRKQINNITVPFLYMLLSLTAITIFTIPLFFKSTFINPLKRLNTLVKKINDNSDQDTNLDINNIDSIYNSVNLLINSQKNVGTELQNYTTTLETMIKDKSSDLYKSNREIKTLKEQLGNNFVQTSYLLKPLVSNNVKSKTIDIQFLIKQKKQIQLQDGSSEQIGGDICSASTVYLQGKPFTIFLNANVQGSTITRAIGAVVLGAVLESILVSSQHLTSDTNAYPEQWINNNLSKIWKSFEKFNGLLIGTMVFGLIDDATGLIYLSNISHPKTVLYRNKRAFFMEDDVKTYQLGDTKMNGVIKIRVFQLEPTDVIIAGSSGRDDILIDKFNSRPALNKDKNAFLKRVEDGAGQLESIYTSIKKQGDPVEDVSLVRISYLKNSLTGKRQPRRTDIDSLLQQALNARQNGNLNTALIAVEKAYKLNDTDLKVLKELVQIHALIKNYTKASEIAEIYINLCPVDTNFLYTASFCLKKAGNLKKSADISERVFIREPQMVKNLVNLAHVYMQMKDYKRSELYLGKALKLDKKNKNALSIKATLSNRSREI